jgi:hypothetical protein
VYTATATQTSAANQAARIVQDMIQDAVETAVARAQVCGCRGCKAQAMQAFEWAQGMLGIPPEGV